MDSIASSTICTVHSIQNPSFLYHRHNDQFLVYGEEDDGYEDDPNTSRASPFSPSVYSETSTRNTQTAFLRITTSHTPRNPATGFIFGRDAQVCDILLDWSKGNISSRQFAVGPNPAGRLTLKNLKAEYTMVDSMAIGKIKLKSQVAIPEGGADAEIRAPKSNHRIRIQLPLFSQPGFIENWNGFLRRFDLQTLGLADLKLKSSTISSTYSRGEELGSGTSGTVYRAKHLPTGQVYALKEFKGDKAKGIFSEAQILQDLSHEHIVGFQDYFMSNGPPSLVMELAEGGNLMQAYRERSLNDSESKAGCSQILSALAYLHDANIIHRDVKPDNIMVQCYDPIFLQLSDFGLACKGNSKELIGTELYTAPEVIARIRYSSKVDIWSLGITFLLFSIGLPMGYEKATPRCLSALSDYLQNHGTDTARFFSRLLCQDPERRPSAVESLVDPFLWLESETTYGPDFDQQTRPLAEDEELTNPLTLDFTTDEGDTELADTEIPNVHAYPEVDVTDPTPRKIRSHRQSSSTSRRNRRPKSKSWWQSIGSKSTHRRKSESWKEHPYYTKQPSVDRDTTDRSGLPSYDLSDRQEEGPHDSYISERSYHDQIQASGPVDIQYTGAPLTISGEADTGLAGTESLNAHGYPVWDSREGIQPWSLPEAGQLPEIPYATYSPGQFPAETGCDADTMPYMASNTYHQSRQSHQTVEPNSFTPTYNLPDNQQSDAGPLALDNLDDALAPAQLSIPSWQPYYPYPEQTEVLEPFPLEEEGSASGNPLVANSLLQGRDYSWISSRPSEEGQQREVIHDNEGWYMTFGPRQTIRIHLPELSINATAMWNLAQVSTKDREIQRARIKKADGLIRASGGSSTWITLQAGKFLSEALGLDRHLDALFAAVPGHSFLGNERNYLKLDGLLPPRPVPKPLPKAKASLALDGNQLPERLKDFETSCDGFAFIKWGEAWIAHDLLAKTVCMTDIFLASGSKRQQTPLMRYRRGGPARFRGNYLPYDDAIRMCRSLNIDISIETILRGLKAGPVVDDGRA